MVRSFGAMAFLLGMSLGIAWSVGPTSLPDEATLQAVVSKAQALETRLVETRRHLHMYPELSNREFETSKFIAERLRALGLDEVRTGVAKTGVVGVLRGSRPGPVVAVRADMDALPVEEAIDVPYKSRNPGVKHACGHDVHMTVALGTAEVLAQWKREGRPLPGTVVFLFQPAEEGPPPGEEGGASLVIREGVLDQLRIQAIFGLHAAPFLPVGTVAYTEGPILASADRFEVIVHGKQTHGAYPHQGIDPIYVGSQIVVNLQSILSRQLDPREPAVVSVGVFQAGNRFNIIPGDARLEGTVRTLREETRRRIPVLMEQIIRGITEAYGATYEFRYEAMTPVTVNDASLVRTLLPALQKLLGADRVIRAEAQMGAEDFGFYAQKIPGFYFWLGVRAPDDPTVRMLHTPEFDADERSIGVGVRAMTTLVLHYLQTAARPTSRR